METDRHRCECRRILLSLQGRVYCELRRFTTHESDVADMLQATNFAFLKALDKGQLDFSHLENQIAAYLLQIARNTAISLIRRRKSKTYGVTNIEYIESDLWPSFEDRRIYTEDLFRLEHYWARIPQAQQDVIKRRVIDGDPKKDIAKESRCNEKTVYNRINAGLKRLREQMDDEKLRPHCRTSDEDRQRG